VDDWVYDIAVDGPLVYVAGGFTYTGSGRRENIAAFDAASGVATAWYPKPDQSVKCVVPTPAGIYVCGAFTTIGETPRSYAACIDPVTGLATGFDPRPDGPFVWALAVDGPVVYLGGLFTRVHDMDRANLVAVNGSSGIPCEWDPGAGDILYALALGGGRLFVGGYYTMIGGVYQPGHAALGPAPTTDVPEGPRRALALGPCVPNPARAGARFAFALAAAGPVTLELLDVRGRRVATPLVRAWREAGTQSVAVSTEGLAPGIYFVRLECNGERRTARFAVVR
jgi:hypothetical protein